jgi:hypothetical protein
MTNVVQFPLSPKYKLWMDIAKQLNHSWSYECREALLEMALASGCTHKQLAKLRQDLTNSGSN